MHVDSALAFAISKFRKLWEETYGEPISEIEMTKMFGEYGQLDIKKLKEIRENGG